MMLSVQIAFLYFLLLITPYHVFRFYRFFVKSLVCVVSWDWRPQPHERLPTRSRSISVLHMMPALWSEEGLYHPTCFSLFRVTVTGRRYNLIVFYSFSILKKRERPKTYFMLVIDYLKQGSETSRFVTKNLITMEKCTSYLQPNHLFHVRRARVIFSLLIQIQL